MAEQGIFRTGLDYITRPGDTTLGLVGELIKGLQGQRPDLAGALATGLSGEGGGGASVVSAISGTPREKFSDSQGVAATALDLLNPTDPLNFVGIGGMSKAGRAGKLLGRIPGAADDLKLAPTVAEQFAKGQRGLLTFGGHAINPPGTALAVKGVAAAGNRALQSGPGRALARSFGGKRATAVFSADNPELQKVTATLYDAVNDIGVPLRGYQDLMAKSTRTLDRLTAEEGVKMGDLISEVARKDKSLQDAMLEFVTTGAAGRQDLRKRAWNAAAEMQEGLAEISGALDKTGLGQYIGPELGFLPRMMKGNRPGEGLKSIDRVFKHGTLLGKAQHFEGQAVNAMNRDLVQRSVMQVTPEFLDDAGKHRILNWKYRSYDKSGRFQDLTGADAFNSEMAQKPGAYKSFLEKHRVSLPELDARLQAADIGRVERNGVRLLKEMQRQVLDNVKTDQLLIDFEARGIMVPWVDELHKVDNISDAKFLKIDRGRWENKPMAISKEWDEAFKHVMNVLSPNPDVAIMGQHMSKILPDPIADFGLTSLMKLNLIYGLLPTPGLRFGGNKVRGIPVSAPGYFSRNYVTGVFNNLVEGLAPNALHPGSMSRFHRHYAEGTRMAGEWGRGVIDGGAAAGKGKGTITLAGDVVIDKARLRQMYVGMNMHGGGTDPFAIGRELTSDSERVQQITRLRKELYHNTTDLKAKGYNVTLESAQDMSEHAIRIPLMLDTVEQTLLAAKRAGIRTPTHIKSLSGRGEMALIENHRRSMQSYRYTKEAGMGNINLDPSSPFTIGSDVVLDEAPGLTHAAFENAREAVIRAHFDYSDLSPLEQRIRNSWIPFYAWTRKNLPRHSLNMFTNFGKYVPFARAYHNAFANQGIDPEDLPVWMSEIYAVPVGDPDGRVRALDLTNYLPMMELVQYGSALFGEPAQSGNRISEAARMVMSQINPLFTLPAEIGLQTDSFTGRRFADAPKESFGLPVGANASQVLGTVRGLSDLDRINPGNVFTRAGELFGSIGPEAQGRRPSRNETSQPLRLLRAATGLTFRDTDPGSNADRTPRQKRSQIKRLQRMRLAARREGDYVRARHFEKEIKRLKR